TSFTGDRIPACDVVVLVKFPVPQPVIEEAARRAKVIYAPLDYYGSPQEIEADGPMLRRCARILVHCERLRPYFERYARVEYMDHHVKFAAPLRDRFKEERFILWAGVRSNLPPLVEWVNANVPALTRPGSPMPGELVVLTNPEKPTDILTP